MRLLPFVFLLLASLPVHLARAADKASAPPATPVPVAESSVTQHSAQIAGHTVHYTATAGTLIIHDDSGKPIASMDYAAYTRDGFKDKSVRPLTFAYNGGPGSSSIWIHMGALGPRRVVTTDAGFTPPPPYKLVDNTDSLLDKTDLVFIDPVGTGFSKPVGEAKGKDFWGVDEDADSIARFIRAYVSTNGRWNSPKYLMGESYGTMRSAAVVDKLQTDMGMAFNGVVLVSTFLDGRTSVPAPGNDEPYVFYLPSFAVISWYHHLLPQRPEQLEPFLDEVRKFAGGEYAHALAEGDDLPAVERKQIIARIHHYTGLSESYIDQANLRVAEVQYVKEIEREQGKTLGVLDARFSGHSFDLLGETSTYDPQSAAISGAFTASFLHYLHSDLKFGRDQNYKVENDELWSKWDWRHQPPGLGYKAAGMADTVPDLAHAMAYNPDLKVLVLQGYYDLATPFYGTEYQIAQLHLTPALRKHIRLVYFQSGHMVYLHPESLHKLRSVVSGFIDETDRTGS